jgi:hypothetical protein
MEMILETIHSLLLGLEDLNISESFISGYEEIVTI